jgi:hypothetical protein
VLFTLQVAESRYFQSIRHFRTEKLFDEYREIFNGENDILSHPDYDHDMLLPEQQRAIPYLFPLFYSYDNESQTVVPTSPFVAFHTPDAFPLLTEMRNTMISTCNTPEFRRY